jgi:selenocysteine lyase/cysteine desulfurase
LANQIGMERIEKRHRALNDWLRAEMLRRGAEDWTGVSHDHRCAMVAVNTPPIRIMDIENAFWAQHRIRIRGGAPHKIRLSTPYWLQKGDIARFLEKFDEFKRNYKTPP